MIEQLTFETSKAAEQAIKPDSARLRMAVYSFIEHNGPCTDEAIANGLGMNPSTERPRRGELVKAGLVRASLFTQKTISGRSAVAWELVPTGS